MLFACPATGDFFRSRIGYMIDLRHPLALLALRMPWQEIQARVGQVFTLIFCTCNRPMSWDCLGW